MSKLHRGRLLLIIILITCVVPLAIYAVAFDVNFPCFGTFFPSERQIEERTNIKFPVSAANIVWHCQPSLESAEIFVRFTIDPVDAPLVIASKGYYPWNLPRPTHFFDLFDDNLPNEEDLEVYNTWQSNSACGWTNLLIDMDDPTIYTVYAEYEDWEDC